MSVRYPRLLAVPAILLALVAALLLAGCAGPDPDRAPARPTPGASGQGAVNTSPDQQRIRAPKVDAIAAEVPAAIRARGTLVVGLDGKGTPPLTFRADDDRTVIGIEPDIAQLVADTLGLRLDVQPTSWENLFLAVDSGQYDAGFSNITVTEERKDSTTSPPTGWTRSRSRRPGPARSSTSPSRPMSPAGPSRWAPARTRSRSCCVGTHGTGPPGWPR
jgi:polar amino acid transport system substrate-binding protein